MTIETLSYHNYTVREERASTIDLDATLTVTTGFLCPRCKKLLKPGMEHAEVRVCSNCKLTMQLYDNALFCSTSPLARMTWR